MFIRPHHKKQYKEMLAALVGQSVSAADGPAISEDQQTCGKELLYFNYYYCIMIHCIIYSMIEMFV